VLCQQLGLFSEALVAIDRSKFRAVNNRDHNFTSAKLQRRMEEIESSINRYLVALDIAGRQKPSVAKAKTARLEDKIAALKTQIQAVEVVLNETPDKQISLTDPDARSMKTRGTGIISYNVQTAVDTKHHLIVAHEVTDVGTDRGQLTSMAKQAQEAMATQKLTAIADRGYFNGEEILASHEAGINVMIPKTVTFSTTANGRFSKANFIYDAERNEYRCPAGNNLKWRYETIEYGMKVQRHWSSNCKSCAMKDQCTPGEQRRVSRSLGT
jgi:hypothetical protein